MKRYCICILSLAYIMVGCSNEDDFSATNLESVLDLIVLENDAEADGVSKNKVIANFPLDFTTEDDGKVKFTVLKEDEQVIEQSIIATSRDGVSKKIAELLITNNKAEVFDITAEISINEVLVSKRVSVNFKPALPDSINVKSSSLMVTPNSFNEIEITTELKRTMGGVSIGTIGETKVVDSQGFGHGLFNNYRNSTDSMGNIVNKFTMGNDAYTGTLYVISESRDVNNQILTDTITIISQ